MAMFNLTHSHRSVTNKPPETTSGERVFTVAKVVLENVCKIYPGGVQSGR